MEMDMVVDPEVHFEIDIMILDYLLCSAINATLRTRIAERREQAHDWNADGSIALFDCMNLPTRCDRPGSPADVSYQAFGSVISSHHSGSPISRDIEIKLQVLTFTTLFCRRYTNSDWNEATILRWRNQNAENARQWLAGESNEGSLQWPALDTLRTDLDQNYRALLLQLKVPGGSQAGSRASLISLLDILPEFMAICAIAAPMLSREISMEIAVLFMMHASVEQCLIFGRALPEVVREAFAWGSQNLSEEHIATNSSSDWRSKRNQYMNYLRPKTDIPLEAHLQTLWSNYPIFIFEEIVLDFLIDLIAKLDVPLLVQLEIGKLAPLSRSDTNMLKQRIGL
jgi:hypothetical protein